MSEVSSIGAEKNDPDKSSNVDCIIRTDDREKKGGCASCSKNQNKLMDKRDSPGNG